MLVRACTSLIIRPPSGSHPRAEVFPRIQVEFWPLGIPPLLSKKLWQLLAFDHGWNCREPWWRLGAFLRFPWMRPRSPLSVGSSRSALSAFSRPLGSVNWRGSSRAPGATKMNLVGPDHIRTLRAMSWVPDKGTPPHVFGSKWPEISPNLKIGRRDLPPR